MSAASPVPPTEGEFQRLVADLDYPMFIVTTAAGDERSGCLVGFATQVSIHPPRFAVWISKQNHTSRVAEGATVMAVHVPTAAQVDLARLFGEETGDTVDKFARCDWAPGPEGVPILAGCPRWVAGRVEDRVDWGDHVGYVLSPVAAEHGESGPQLGYQQVRDLDPGHPA